MNGLINATFAKMKIFTFFIQLLYAQKSSESEKQPNIVYILADDLGWGDVNWNNKLGSHYGPVRGPLDHGHWSEFVVLISWTRVS